jgi:hypothetical protein
MGAKDMKNKKSPMIFLSVLIFLIPISSFVSSEYIACVDESLQKNSLLHGGWLEEQNGVKILHLNGSYYNMGFQHGFFLKNEIQVSMRTQLTFFEEHEFDYEKILGIGNIMNKYLPSEYMEEMQGMADGADMSFEDIVVLSTMPALLNIVFAEACCEISLWGNATLDGKLLHVRSWDWSLSVLDPETGIPLQENMVMIVRTPEVGYASLSAPENPGAITSWNGVNEKGIVIGENTCLTEDITYQGISPAFRMRMVLDQCATVDEALALLTSNRTCGTNFVLSDANIPIGYALDQTANISYVGTWDNPVEYTYPFWQIEDVIRRTPGYIDPDCAAVEVDRIRYDPSGLRAIWDAFTGKSYMVFFWIHYRALSNQIVKYYGTLDINSTMDALREEYRGKTDFWMLMATKLGGSYQCLCQWVLCPDTGNMIISFASTDRTACYEPVKYFNIFELMEAEPP